MTTLTFDAPRPGTWEHDLSHCPPSATPVFRRLASTTMTEAYRGVFAEWGAPLETMEVRFVHGKMYRRLVPLVGADRTAPHLRGPCSGWPHGCTRRFGVASEWPSRTLAERPYLDVVEGWHGGERQVWVERNVAVQAVEPHALDDGPRSLTISWRWTSTACRAGSATTNCTAATSARSAICSPMARRRGARPGRIARSAAQQASPASCEGRSHGRRIAEAPARHRPRSGEGDHVPR